MNLEGKIAIVTGGSQGLGLAIAEALRARGVIVETCSLNPPASAFAHNVDVCDSRAVDSFVKEVMKKHGRIDILVNNAGYAGKPASLEKTSDATYAKTIRTNTDGVFHFFRAVVPLMKEQGTGMLVTIGSRAGHRAHPGISIYSASKFAVRGMTEALAKELQELEKGIRCFVISPGGIDTPMRTELFGEKNSARQQKPEQVAAIITEIIEGKREVPHGGNVVIVGGEVVEVREME